MNGLGIIEYISGLTSYVLDESVIKRIAFDRNVLDKSPERLDQRQKDLLLADVLHAVWLSPESSSSFSRQHGQFSTTVGAQRVGDRQALYDMMVRLYRKWGENDKVDSMPQSSLKWME